MANTISTLYFANTFGDMMVSINADSNEVNAIGKGNWTKDTGTMFLNGPSVGLQVGNNAIVQGQLQVSGVSSSLYVQNNANVAGTLYLSNNINSLWVGGSANVYGQIFANGAGNSLVVANNATVGGNVSVTGTLTVTSPTALNSTLAVLGTSTISNTLTVSGLTTLSNAAVIVQNITGQQNLNIYGNAALNTLQANTSVNTATLAVTGQTYTNVLQANTSINTGTLAVAGVSYSNIKQANTSINTPTLSVSGQTYTNVLQANTSVNTGTLAVSGQTYTGVLQANTSINVPVLAVSNQTYTNNLQANTNVVTSSLAVTNQAYTNVLQANTSVNTGTLSVSGQTYTGVLQANTSVNTGTLAVSGQTYTNNLQANTNIATSSLAVSGNTFTNIMQANSFVNTATLFVTGVSYSNIKQANTSINTPTLSVSGQTYTGVLQANTSVNTGTLAVSGQTYTNVLQANTSINTGTLAVSGQTYTGVLQANTSVNTGTLSVSNTSFTNSLQANASVNTATLSVTGQTYTGVLQANTSINTGTLAVSGQTYTGVLQSNTSVNTGTLSVAGQTYTNVVQANTSINTPTLSVSGQTYTNNVQANTSVNTATLAVTGQTYTNVLQANTSVNTGTLAVSGQTYTNNLQANTSVNTATLSVTGQTYTNVVQANASINTGTLAVSGQSYTGILQANTSINVPVLAVSNQAYTNVLQSNTSINTPTLAVSGNIAVSNLVANTTLYSSGVTTLVGKANTISDIGIGGNAYITGKTVMNAASNTVSDFAIGGNLYVPNTLMMGYSSSSANVYNLTVPFGGAMTVAGNFIQSSPTIYSSASFTLYQAPVGITSGNYAMFAVNRLPGANAEIRWDETNKYWGIKDVSNPTSYSQIMTANLVSNALNSSSSTTVASSFTVNTLNNQDTVIYAQANAATISAQSAYNKANTGGLFSGDVTVSGNLIVNGTTTTVNSQTVQTNDSLIELAASNPADSLDIGFYGQYVSGTTKYTGLVRTAGSQYTLFQGISANPTTNSIGTITSTNYATLYGNFAGGTGSFSTVSASGTVSSTNSTGVELQALNGAGGFTKMGITNTGSSLGYINATNNFAVQVNGTQAGLFATTGLSVSGNVIASTGLNITGSGGFFNSANKFGIDNNSGTTRMYASGPNSSTRGSYDFRVTDSVGTLDSSAMTLTGSGLTVTNSIISGGGATIGSDIQQSASAGFLYNNGGSPGVVNSGFYLDGAGKNLRFYVNSTEISRFDNYGDLLIGQTSAGYQNSNSIALQPSATGGLVVNHASGAAAGSAFANFGYAGASIGTISQNGTTGINLNATGQLQLTGSTVITATVASSDNSTSVATTAFVKNQSYITSSGAPVQSVGGNTGSITNAQIAASATAGYGYTPYNPANLGSASVNYASSAGSVAWTGVSGRPTNLSSFTNDLGNYGGWITSSASISGTAYNITQYTVNQSVGTGNNVQFNSAYVTSAITVGVDGSLPTNGYNISTPAYGGAIELRSNGGTVNRGWRLGMRDSSTGYTPHLTFLDSDGVIKAYVGISVTGNISASNFSGTSSGTNTGDQTNISGNAATASSVAWTGVSGRPTNLSSFSNDLGNYGGWITAAGSCAYSTNSGTASVTAMSSGRSDGAAYPIVWGTTGSSSQLYSASSCTITSSTGTISATTFSGSGSGLTGTASSLTAGGANYVAWGNVGSRPTNLSQFTNDLGNYGGWITGITSGNVTTALGYTPYNAASIGSASVNYASSAGSVAWTGVSGRPTNLSSFTNDLGNYGGWITSSASISGTASNITSYTINQSVGTGNSPSFANTTLSGRLLVGNGSAGAPSVAFSSDGGQDTGLYWSADGYTNFTNNAVYSGYVGPGGNMVMTGNITAYGSSTAPSDIRLKKNITRIENALDKVCQLGGYTFDRVDRNVARQTGVIAQEVQKVLPEAIFELDDENKTLTVAYGNMVGLLIEAIKELRSEIDELKNSK